MYVKWDHKCPKGDERFVGHSSGWVKLASLRYRGRKGNKLDEAGNEGRQGAVQKALRWKAWIEASPIAVPEVITNNKCTKGRERAREKPDWLL